MGVSHQNGVHHSSTWLAATVTRLRFSTSQPLLITIISSRYSRPPYRTNSWSASLVQDSKRYPRAAEQRDVHLNAHRGNRSPGKLMMMMAVGTTSTVSRGPSVAELLFGCVERTRRTLNTSCVCLVWPKLHTQKLRRPRRQRVTQR